MTYVFQVGAATHKMYNGFDDNHGTLADCRPIPGIRTTPTGRTLWRDLSIPQMALM